MTTEVEEFLSSPIIVQVEGVEVARAKVEWVFYMGMKALGAEMPFEDVRLFLIEGLSTEPQGPTEIEVTKVGW